MLIERNILDSSEIPSSVKHLIRALNEFTDTEGKCWPNQETLARRTSLSVRTIRYSLKLAIELKLVSVRRRWRKSNVYKVLCLQKVNPKKIIHNEAMVSQGNNPINFIRTFEPKTTRINPREMKIVFEDSEQVLGSEITKRNRGWLITLMQKVGVDAVCEGLRWLKNRMLEGAMTGEVIRNPGGLLKWRLEHG